MIIINFLDAFYAKLPRLSTEIRAFIVRLLPYIAVITGAIMTFASVVEIIGTPFFSIFTLGEGISVFVRLLIVNILGIAEGILLIWSFRTLIKRVRKGWNLVFWSQVLWIIGALISMSPSFILGFIFFYPLFQIRNYYR